MGAQEDFRRAAEPELLDAIRDGHALALAEAYHRLIPASHAVARRLLPTAEVESAVLGVFTQLWEQAPMAGPLEAWTRRTTWAVCAERLRAEGRAPASPSAAALLPDLPTPELRFVDAAERAIAELPDDERRALLLAHDKGVPSDSQDDGAADALVRALLALAGPETSTSDRTALQDDDCSDFPTMGDWCLGVAEADTTMAIDAAIAERGGCAAKSRALRRGRRRIEGLPATPDMGQRVLVSVLTGSDREAAPQPAPAPSAPEPEGSEPDTAMEPVVVTDAVMATQPAEATPADAPADGLSIDADASHAALETDDAAIGADIQTAATADPMIDTADLPQAGGDEAVERAAAAAEADDWKPKPGDTAELRLSDILADGEEEDDPFADLDRDEPAPAVEATVANDPANPYSALSALDETAPAPLDADTPLQMPMPATPDPLAPSDPNVYVEGQEIPAPAAPAPRRSPVAAVLAWVLPILGGLAVGVLLAVQVFGPPT